MSPSPAHADEVQCLLQPGRCVDHTYRGKCCCGGQHPMQESRREIMALRGEKHPLPWQASTGLSLFQRHASHIATPQAQAMMKTAPSSEHPGEEELWSHAWKSSGVLWCARVLQKVEPGLGSVCQSTASGRRAAHLAQKNTNTEVSSPISSSSWGSSKNGLSTGALRKGAGSSLPCRE